MTKEELIENGYDEVAVDGYLSNWINIPEDEVEDYLDDFEEAYQGKYDSDEDFVQELLESCGDIPSDLPAYIYIDWEQTANDVMMDYYTDNGHYFRQF